MVRIGWCEDVRVQGKWREGDTWMPAWNIRRRTRGEEYSRSHVAEVGHVVGSVVQRQQIATRFEDSATDGRSEVTARIFHGKP